MHNLPVPNGSQIEKSYTTQGYSIQWKNPDNLLSRYGSVAFMLFWLGGWSIGETTTAQKLWTEFQQGKPLVSFEIIWLGGWTVAGLSALSYIYPFLRDAGTTQLVLGNYELTYNPGRQPTTEFLLNKTKQVGNSFIYTGGNNITAKKQDISNLQLIYIGERLRLSFDIGAQRIEVGEYLTEPEKEWLHKTIENWLS